MKNLKRIESTVTIIAFSLFFITNDTIELSAAKTKSENKKII